MSSTPATEADATQPPPGAASRAQVATDVPALLPLLDACPGVHVYTAASGGAGFFAALAGTLAGAASGDDVPVGDVALVRPTSEAETVAAVRACAAAAAAAGDNDNDNGDAAIPAFAVRNSGANAGGRSSTRGGVSIDVRSLAHIALAPDRRSVRIGGGVVLGALLAYLDREGLDTPVGWGASIGYVGWASAGGYGMSVPARGMGADQILGGRVVTASGEVVVATEEAAAAGDEAAREVLWALRGAGAGVLGVVTELTVRVYPRPRLVAGQMLFPRAEAAAVFAGLEALYRDQEAEGEAQVDADADADGHRHHQHRFCAEVLVIDPLADGGMLLVYFWYELDPDAPDGDHARARALHDRVAAFGTLLSDTVVGPDGKLNETTPYEFLQAVELKTIIKAARQYFRLASQTTPSFSAALGRIFAAQPHPTASSAIVMHVCRGAGTRPRAGATAFAHRAPHVVFSAAGFADWDDAAACAAADAWTAAVAADVEAAGLATGWKYANFNPPEPGDGRLYLGAAGVRRLRRLKARYDPRNLFAKSTPDLSE